MVSETIRNYQLYMSGLALVLFAIIQWLAIMINNFYRKQNFVRMPLMDEKIKNKNYQLLGYQFLFLLGILAIAWVLGGAWFEFFAGGYLVLLLICLFLALQNFFYMKGLCTQEAAEGMVMFSKVFSCRFTAQWLFSAGIVIFIFFLLLRNLLFLGGCYFIFTTALGFLRQARITARTPTGQGKN